MSSHFLSRYSVRRRLTIGFAVVPVIMVALIATGVVQVNAISRGLTTINDVNSVKQRYAINFRGSVHDRAISLRDVVLFESGTGLRASLQDIERLREVIDGRAENRLRPAVERDVEVHTPLVTPLALREIQRIREVTEAAQGLIPVPHDYLV